jgi:hypothetical protein
MFMPESVLDIAAFEDWAHVLEKENLLLSFKGEFNQELINAILILSSGKHTLDASNVVVKTRIFSIIVECLQNICKHGADDLVHSEIKPGILLISKHNKTAVISVGNLIPNADVNTLTQKIDDLKKMSKDELKAHAKNVLQTGRLSAKSGAGLGLITIIRKSEGIEYEIKKFSDEISFFSLQVSVSTEVN